MDPEGTSVEEPQAAPDVVSTVEGEQPVERTPEPVGTMEGAFERAMARESESAGQEGDKPSDAPPATDAPEKPEAPPQPTTQQQLDRLYSMYRQGRTAELTSQERGLLNRLVEDARKDVTQEAADEQIFREMYLTYLSWQEEEPAKWVDLTAGKVMGQDGKPLDPVKVLQFMDAYRAQHPDVSLVNPDAPTTKRGDVRRDAMVEAFERVDTAIAFATGEHGLTEGELQSAAEKANGDFTQYLSAVIKAAVDKAVEKERPKIAKSERKAWDAEKSALRAQTFKTGAAAGLPGQPSAGRQTGAKPGSWEAALLRASERVEAAS